MSNYGHIDLSELLALQEKMRRLSGADKDVLIDSCAQELAARLLRELIKNTPVGQYPVSTGKQGGTLRRGWMQKPSPSPVYHSGVNYVIEIKNPVNYASYVEYGHRTRGGKGWVQGKLIMTKAEIDISRKAPGILEKKVNDYLKGLMSGD